MAGDMVTSRVGRRRIVCDPMPLTRDNVGDVVRVASRQHAQNAGDIDSLHRYFLGYQPIINRAKEVRPEIDSRVVENRADEIVSFKVGYQLGDPIKYVSRPTGDTPTPTRRPTP